MRVRIAEDLCQRIVNAKAKLSFPLFALKKGKIIRQKFLNFFSADECKPSTKVEECQIIC